MKGSISFKNLKFFSIITFYFIVNSVHGIIEPLRYSPFSSYFHNEYDYADAESYSASLFTNLYQHMNAIKREQNMCKAIPVPKTILKQKYFNPEYEFMNYKYWYPPKDHQYVILWSQNEAYRNSLFLSYMLQDDNAKFPPGWLYLYLSVAAQLHSLQTIGFNSHKIVKGIKLPFESNEVFKVNWWTNGNFQKFEKPFALYAGQPRPNDPKYVKVIDFGTGNYSNDYTGHAFLGNYLFDRQMYILNNTYEISKNWKKPFQYQPSLNSAEIGLNQNIFPKFLPNDPLNAQRQQQYETYKQQQQSQQIQTQQHQLQFQQNSVLDSKYQSLQPKQPFLQQFQNPNQYPLQPIQSLITDRSDRNELSNPINQVLNQQNQYLEQKLPYNQDYSQQQPFDGSNMPYLRQKPVSSLDEFSPFVYINKDKVPIKDWDPLIDNHRNNLNRIPDRNSPIGFDQWYINSIMQNTAYEGLKQSFENPFILKHLKYIETYRYAKVWWNNESAFFDNKEEYVYRIKPGDSHYRFTGAKYQSGTKWTSPYFWCVDPTNWLVTAMSPIWASNDYEYKNKLFLSDQPLRFVGLSEVVLNFEEVDINQCPGDRQLNAFSSTSLCDSTTECLPRAYYGLTPGAYECQCLSNFFYPPDIQGPYKGKELSDNAFSHPLCIKSEGLLQYPNWISKNALEYQMPNIAISSVDREFNLNLKKRSLLNETLYSYINELTNGTNSNKSQVMINKKSIINNTILSLDNHKINLTKVKTADNIKTSVNNLKKVLNDSDNKLEDKIDNKSKKNAKKLKRNKRFVDKRNNFEKLRDSIYVDQDLLRRRCLSRPYQDILLLNEDDERFILNTRYHVNQIFKPQMAQAIRIAHVLSAYLQLHSPFGTSSVNSQNEFGKYKNFGTTLKPDPQLEEYIIVGEIMSTLQSNYPIQEVNVFFNGSEFKRQKFFSSQNTLGFGVSMIRSDIELLLNRSNDDTHLTKSWYLDAINRFIYGGDRTNFGGPYNFEKNEYEKKFYQSAGPFESSINNQFRFDRYGIEMSLRSSFDGMHPNSDLTPKFYDAPSSGVWFGPYYDCQKRYMKTKTTLRMSYSVPIITSITKLPVGFVSIVIGSDLKWWKINPCDTSSERNMFQGIHRCDQETTMCAYQDVPDFETGYFLGSYKCVCKANYEFPFMDYGTSYFEGATVEKEYEKKIKGQPNIYDRLKCRPVNTVRNLLNKNYWNSTSHAKFNNLLIYLIITFYILLIHKLS